MKFKLFKNKKAVSPLIATVLLVMIVVSIGAAVMLALKGLTEGNLEKIEEKESEMECLDAGISIRKISGTYEICLDHPDGGSNGTVASLLENTGSLDITGLRYTVIGNQNVNSYNYSLSEDMAKGDMQYVNFTYEEIATFRQIEVVPVIGGHPKRGNMVCHGRKMTWTVDELKDC